MDSERFRFPRRSVVIAGLSAGAAGLLGPFGRKASAQKATILAKRVDSVPGTPDHEMWRAVDPLLVPLAPQAVVKPRTYEAGVSAVSVRAVYDDDRLAFLLSWGDASRQVGIGGVNSFRDAVAIQFPGDPQVPVPFFGMGEANNPVTIYQWKSDWQFDRGYDRDDAFPAMAVDWYPFSGRDAGQIAEGEDYGAQGADKAFHTSWWVGNTLADPALQARTSVEKLAAEGFGTVTPAPKESQDGLGNAVWKEGGWELVLSVPRKQDRFTFERGATVPVAFAAWDGTRQERGGEKAVSTWYFLNLEQPTGPMTYISPVLVVIGVAIAQVVTLRFLRRKSGGVGGKEA